MLLAIAHILSFRQKKTLLRTELEDLGDVRKCLQHSEYQTCWVH